LDEKRPKDKRETMRQAHDKNRPQTLEYYDQEGDSHLSEEARAPAKANRQKSRQKMRERFKRDTLGSITSAALTPRGYLQAYAKQRLLWIFFLEYSSESVTWAATIPQKSPTRGLSQRIRSETKGWQ
jgi:hypothetical protein